MHGQQTLQPGFAPGSADLQPLVCPSLHTNGHDVIKKETL